MPQDCLEQSRLTAMEGGNAARLPGAIAAATSLWFSNPGAVAEAKHKFAWSEFEQPIRLARRAKTKEGFRNEK